MFTCSLISHLAVYCMCKCVEVYCMTCSLISHLAVYCMCKGGSVGRVHLSVT